MTPTSSRLSSARLVRGAAVLLRCPASAPEEGCQGHSSGGALHLDSPPPTQGSGSYQEEDGVDCIHAAKGPSGASAADLSGVLASSADEREHSCAKQRKADRQETEDAESQKLRPRKGEGRPSSHGVSTCALRQQDDGDDEPAEEPPRRRISLGSHDQQVDHCYFRGDGSRDDRPEVPKSRQRLTHPYSLARTERTPPAGSAAQNAAHADRSLFVSRGCAWAR
jgi:hypothetical protein